MTLQGLSCTDQENKVPAAPELYSAGTCPRCLVTTPHPGVVEGILRPSNPAPPLVQYLLESPSLAGSSVNSLASQHTISSLQPLRPLEDVGPSDPPEPVAAGLVRWTVLSPAGQHLEEPPSHHRQVTETGTDRSDVVQRPPAGLDHRWWWRLHHHGRRISHPTIPTSTLRFLGGYYRSTAVMSWKRE